MKSLVKYLVKSYLRLGFFFYYKKINLLGLENISNDKPVFFLPNHHNSLVDPLLIATHIPGFAHYLTRASVFKKPIIAKLLKFFGLVPIYRMRDGYSTLGKNQEIFDYCVEQFGENEKLLAFPEANHNIQRRVRKLSKGFTRIVFQELSIHPESKLELIPIGFNYQAADQCPDSVSIIFGEPIYAQKYKSENEKELTEHLRRNVQDAISKLTTNIPRNSYLEITEELESSQVDYLDPKAVNEYIENGFQNYQGKKRATTNPLSKFFKLLLIVNLLLPYAFWNFFVKPKIKEKEFISTFRFTVAVTVVPLYLIIIMLILTLLLGIEVALIYVAGVLLVALITVKL